MLPRITSPGKVFPTNSIQTIARARRDRQRILNCVCVCLCQCVCVCVEGISQLSCPGLSTAIIVVLVVPVECIAHSSIASRIKQSSSPSQSMTLLWLISCDGRACVLSHRLRSIRESSTQKKKKRETKGNWLSFSVS